MKWALLTMGAGLLTMPGLLVLGRTDSDHSGTWTRPVTQWARPSAPAGPQHAIYNAPYDGRFTFVRVRFTPSSSGDGYYWGGPDLKWDHDYPRAERNLMKILKEVSGVDPYMHGGNVFALDDPELNRFPVAYLCEPGFWTMNPREVEGLRAYLRKGGFLIVDDFRGYHWDNFARQLHRALPDEHLVELDITHPIFTTFFQLASLDFPPPYSGDIPVYYGVFENNDPTGRLMVIVNYNNDIGDYWEWSDAGYIPIELSNEAYKLGVNYIIYGMTH